MIRLAFVVPRYGLDVLGGAETITRRLVERLPAVEFRADVLTTCARDMTSWRNVYPPGPSDLHGVPVYRFPIASDLRNACRYRALTNQLSRCQPVTADEEREWIHNGAHSPALYDYITRQGQKYDLLFFGPYLAGTTFYGTAIWPGHSILWPHLHDEPFAYFQETRLMMEACRGIMFNSEPERALAQHRLGIRNPLAFLVGEGVEERPGDPDRFRRRFGLQGPFLLYAGRLEAVKNILELVLDFQAYRRARPDRALKLVLVGKGPLALPDHPDIVSLGYLGRRDLADAYAAAMVLCQPSLVESFSLVLMEAWLAGTPVLVHGHSPVTRHHALTSNGGLYFTSVAEFAGALDWFLDHEEQRQRMGMLGRAYAQDVCSWPTVLERFRESVMAWLPPGS